MARAPGTPPRRCSGPRSRSSRGSRSRAAARRCSAACGAMASSCRAGRPGGRKPGSCAGRPPRRRSSTGSGTTPPPPAPPSTGGTVPLRSASRARSAGAPSPRRRGRPSIRASILPTSVGRPSWRIGRGSGTRPARTPSGCAERCERGRPGRSGRGSGAVVAAGCTGRTNGSIATSAPPCRRRMPLPAASIGMGRGSTRSWSRPPPRRRDRRSSPPRTRRWPPSTPSTRGWPTTTPLGSRGRRTTPGWPRGRTTAWTPTRGEWRGSRSAAGRWPAAPCGRRGRRGSAPRPHRRRLAAIPPCALS